MRTSFRAAPRSEESMKPEAWYNAGARLENTRMQASSVNDPDLDLLESMTCSGASGWGKHMESTEVEHQSIPTLLEPHCHSVSQLGFIVFLKIQLRTSDPMQRVLPPRPPSLPAGAPAL